MDYVLIGLALLSAGLACTILFTNVFTDNAGPQIESLPNNKLLVPHGKTDAEIYEYIQKQRSSEPSLLSQLPFNDPQAATVRFPTLHDHYIVEPPLYVYLSHHSGNLIVLHHPLISDNHTYIGEL
jgi:hypothetical protein